ncbi:Hint domain-containing protein [Luteimicrobium subarcticum]|uniref:Intein n=1 Tax=Luteimicrobium subarcticum TaxID=620910 RepID=A0A2M8WWA5_9MICO|nr:Hint domain-containing protein [Luteimicrobium subarcticum]PJI95200.1 intein [Luteimicrobium subarcticum]
MLFAGSTAVLLADGTQKHIRDVTTGDKVLATDPETGEQASEPVEQVFTHTDHSYKVTLDDGTSLTTTANRPFWSATDNQFERADHLTTGERVLGADGKPHTIAASRPTTHVGTADNLSIRNIHTYHVGADDILVHNTCAEPFLDDAGEIYVRGKHTTSGATRDASKGYFHDDEDLYDLAEDAGNFPHLSSPTETACACVTPAGQSGSISRPGWRFPPIA